MNTKISQLFREIEAEKGVRSLMILSLKSLKDAVEDYKGKNLIKDLGKLLKVIYNTEPKIALVIDQFYSVMDSLYDNVPEVFSGDDENKFDVKGHIQDAIKEIMLINLKKEVNLLKNGLKIIKDGDTILIHSNSRSITDLLMKAKKRGKKFDVILAEQEFDKTLSILKLIQKHDISVRVVPEYMLSHIEEEVTKVFLGVVTLNSQMNFVADAGTLAIVSEFNLKKVPIFAFTTTGKFSLWKTHKKHHTYKVKHKRSSNIHHIEYDRLKFSHDRVPISYISNIVTDEGLFSPSGLEKLYWQKVKEREKWYLSHNWDQASD